jgi:hypothetical protein
MLGVLIGFIIYKIMHTVQDSAEYLSDILPIQTHKLTNLTDYFLENGIHKKKLYNYNPSLFIYKGQMYKVYRVSNFTYCNYYEHMINAVQRNINYICIESPNNNIILVDYPKSQLYLSCNEPYEDPRAIVMQNRLLLVCNAQEYKCKNKMVLLIINLDHTDLDHIKNIRPDKIVPLKYDNANVLGVEKNWVPFISDQTLHFLYHINPQIVLTCDLNSGICTKIVETYYDHFPDKLRGGTQAVLVRNQYYLAAGHVLHKIVFKKIYFTFFYTFHKDFPFHITGISKPFFLDKNDKGVIESNFQFASGLEIVDDVVYLTYGYNDCESCMITFHVDDLDKIIPH